MTCDYPWEWHLNWYSFLRRVVIDQISFVRLVSYLILYKWLQERYCIQSFTLTETSISIKEIVTEYISSKRLSRYLYVTLSDDYNNVTLKIIKRESTRKLFVAKKDCKLIASKGNKLSSCGNKGRSSCIVKTEVHPAVTHRRNENAMHDTYRKSEPGRRVERDQPSLGGEFLGLTQLQRDDNDIVPSVSKSSS